MGRRVAAGLSLAALLATTVATLTLGAVAKAPCASGDWADGRQYKRLCYSDIVPLYGSEVLAGGRLPYLDRCPESAGDQCDEYPVLTMYFMRAAAWISTAAAKAVGSPPSFAAFFWANAVLLLLCALATTWALRSLVGDRSLYFAAAPTLLIYGFVNWDLLAVALATLGVLAFARRRDGWAGALLGLGAAAKLFPAFLLLPLVAERLREGRRREAVLLGAASAASWTVVDAPFAIVAPHAWSTFFRFNALRPVDWDSLWYVLCQRVQGGVACSWSHRAVDAAAAALFVGLTALVWWLRRRREPGFPRWTLGFPILVLFLLTNKVYSPQYGLWLLPWFALALPDPWLFAAFEVTDAAVFLTRFSWFGRFSADLGLSGFAGYRGLPLGAFQIALVLRALVLGACVVSWVRGRGLFETGVLRLRRRVTLAEPGQA